MKKINSRKLWAWIVWGVITICTLIFAREHFTIVIPWYGGVTTLYIGGQSVVDAMAKLREK